jgi:alkylhydroperoxidase/carboxymuconolactone decarboxylase family protein YurZ
MEETRLMEGIITQLGPLDMQSMQLMNLTAVVASKSLSEIEMQIDSSLKMGIAPSSIYHAIIGVSDTIGLNRALSSLRIAERIVNEPVAVY